MLTGSPTASENSPSKFHCPHSTVTIHDNVTGRVTIERNLRSTVHDACQAQTVAKVAELYIQIASSVQGTDIERAVVNVFSMILLFVEASTPPLRR